MRRIAATGQTMWRGLCDHVGPSELCVIVALGLIVKGLSLIWMPGAYLAPGIVLLWCGLPSRPRFLDPPSSGRTP